LHEAFGRIIIDRNEFESLSITREGYPHTVPPEIIHSGLNLRAVDNGNYRWNLTQYDSCVVAVKHDVKPNSIKALFQLAASITVRSLYFQLLFPKMADVMMKDGNLRKTIELWSKLFFSSAHEFGKIL